MRNAREEAYEAVELFGHMALFRDCKIDKSTVPDGLFCYEIRHSDEDNAVPGTLEQNVLVDFMATIICKTDFGLLPKAYIEMDKNSLNFLGCIQDIEGYLREWEPSNEALPTVYKDLGKWEWDTLYEPDDSMEI